MTLARGTPGNKRTPGTELAVLATFKKGIPMEEAVRRANEAGLVIASNKRLGKVLVGSDKWQDITRAFPCWSGTMTAYEEPNKRIGKLIEYTDLETGISYTFPVPEEHRGKKNILLVAEHPNFSLVKDGGERIVQATEIEAADRFPTSNGWYFGNPVYDIPCGYRVDKTNQEALFLWRMEKRVGLVVRDNYNPVYVSFGKAIYLNAPPSNELGVAVEGTRVQVEAAARLLEQLNGNR